MQINNLVQGTPEWHEFRLKHFGASEAAAMLGLSRKIKRNELLHAKSTGIPKEYSDWLIAHVFNPGHGIEEQTRPMIEKAIGDDLYPVVCSDGDLSASCDGLTMDGITAWENKQFNQEYFYLVADGIVPEEHMPQCQQVLMVTGAKRLIFSISDGTGDKLAYTIIEPSQEWFERIRAGWAQFKIDLASYQQREIAEKPQSEVIMDLPSLAVQATGMVTASNLPEFKAAADKYISGINTNLQTDQHFADAEATVKFCKKTEETLEVTKKAILAQTPSIAEVISAVEHIQKQLAEKRLQLDKLVKSEKEKRKGEIVAEVNTKYAAHVSGLQAEISGIRLHLLLQTPDFGGCLKNLRTLASMHDALDTALANGKIQADSVAKDVRDKLAWCKENADGYGTLFPDLQSLIGMAQDAFQAVVKNRISEHEREKKEREEEKAKAEQEKAQQATAMATPAPATSLDDVVHAAAPSQVAEVIAPSDNGNTIKLGEINERLRFMVNAEFLASLGFEAKTVKNACLYRECDFPAICKAIANHVLSVAKQ